ncbi:pyruvate ferredoxin oxidoreductase [uncultured Prevotella sp.]|uniref:pyruvate ferredoxin oxidoreductase n=1 Tax=uncultured Prevotella sp. TaxID=159272 RepID=UPI00258A2F54|nr:pyruvate ferredoxin oxidoreductase [uncultured Prevotella sp.]
MDYKYIEQLMDRYFEAETTLKEEQILKAFFEQSEEELPENLRAYRELFTSFEQDEMLGDDFDERMLQMIEEKPQVKARTISLSERFRPLMRAAAVVAILITLTTALNQSFKEDKVWTDQSDYALKYEATGNEPAMAYDHSTDSLVSDSLYKPTGYLE